MFPKLIEIKPLKDFQLWLKFDDRREGNVSFAHLANTEVFSAWKNNVPFENVFIDPETNAIAWNEMMEVSTDAQYLKLRGITFEELKAEQTQASVK